MFFAESSLLLTILLFCSFTVFLENGEESQIKQSATCYVLFLFSVLFSFEYYSKYLVNPCKIKASLDYLWNERENTGNGIVIGTCLLPLSLLIHCVIIDPATNQTLLPYFDASISTSLVILVFWILGMFPILRIIPLLGRFIFSLAIVSYAFAIWTKGRFLCLARTKKFS